jgi:hypothetical protein
VAEASSASAALRATSFVFIAVLPIRWLSYRNVKRTVETRRFMLTVTKIGVSFAGCVDLPWSVARLDVARNRGDQLFA